MKEIDDQQSKTKEPSRDRASDTDNIQRQPRAKSAVVCLSGGMDSTSLLLHLLARGIDVYGVSYLYGQKHHLELDRLNANLRYLNERGIHVKHHVVDMSVLGEMFHSALINESWRVPEGFYEQDNMKETVVPNRNAIFASIAYGYALSVANRMTEREIDVEQLAGVEDEPLVSMALGVHQGDHAIYPDCRPSFYGALWRAFSEGNWDSGRVELYLPYLEGDKYTILKDAEGSAKQLDLDFDTIFRNTSTSYDPDSQGRASGRTGADVERILAFHHLGRKDPVAYVEPWEDVLANALRVADEHRQN